MKGEVTAQDGARAKLLATSWSTWVAKQKGVKEESPNTIAHRKYTATEKGRTAIRKVNNKYYETHKEEFKEKVKVFHKNFEEKYGCNYDSWLYWRRKLERENLDFREVPEEFSKILRVYIVRKKYKEVHNAKNT